MRSVPNGAELARLFCLHAAPYAIGLAHFFSWLRTSGEDPDRVTRQIVGSYITEFAQGAKQGAVGAKGGQTVEYVLGVN